MSSTSTPAHHPVMTESKDTPSHSSSHAVSTSDADSTIGTCLEVVAPGDAEQRSQDSAHFQQEPSTAVTGSISQSRGSQARLNDSNHLPKDTPQHEGAEPLNMTKGELAAAKPLEPHPVPVVPSKENVLSVHLPEDVKQEEARRLFGVLSQVDAVKTTGGKTYNYEEKYPEDAPGEELGPDARVFKVYNDEAEKYDADMVRGFRDSLDGLLVFASLFSAVVTTILMQTVQVLPTDQSRITNHLLYETTLLLRANGNATALNSISPSPYGPDSNTFGTNDIWINGLFIASLTLSLTTALLSVLAKQWLQAYMSVTSGSARDVALIRHLRFVGLERWKLHEFIGALPLILHTSLGLFFSALFVFVRTLYPALGWIVVSISGVTLIVYLGTIILPTFSLECPFRLPVFYRTLQNAERLAVAEGSRSRHSNPIESITWLFQLSSNATVKLIAAWTIGSKKAWDYRGIWDFLTPDAVQFLFDAVRRVDPLCTFTFRALNQLHRRAFATEFWIPEPPTHIQAAAVRYKWKIMLSTQLGRAIQEGRIDYVRVMVVTWGTSADSMFNDMSVLQLAIIYGHLNIVKFLVAEGKANVNLLLPPDYYGSALATAANEGQLEAVKFLVTEGGADANLLLTAGEYGSALAVAAFRGRLEVVKFLVTEGGADVNLLLTAGKYGSAPAAAAYHGQLEVLKFLVAKGADITLQLCCICEPN
ncbi:hypothetical protein DL96DRAFT_1563440 [Flagelloscypha sp. PMI_526]|nr:hypothetical protein DL96DRAFT_1563440 [Flagelloscypha sp. PMI_526]